MAIRTFRIVLDGVAHEVEVEELNVGASAPAAVAAAPTRPAPAAAPVAAAAPAARPAAASGSIAAPLQGTILAINVTPGQSVKAGETLLLIEAMKMENEVVAPADGVVASIAVNKGDTVNAGDPLLALQ